MAKDSRGSSGSSPSSGRKSRSPTIDLSAQEVKRGPGEAVRPPADQGGSRAAEPSGAGKAEAPPHQAPSKADTPAAASSPPGAQSPGAEQPRSKPEQPIPSAFAPPPPRSADPSGAGLGERSGRGGRAGWAAGLLTAALAGGLIALAGLFLLDRAGVLPLTGGTEETAALRDRAVQLEQELAAARQASELARDDLQTQVADLNERLAQLAEAAPPQPAPDSALDEEVARLQAALSELRDQVGGAEPPAALGDVDARLQQVEALAERVAQLAEQVELLQAAPGGAPADVQENLDGLLDQVAQLRTDFERLDLAPLQDEIAALAGRMDELQGQIAGLATAEDLASLEARLGELAHKAARAEALGPAVAAQSLAAALATGRPFAHELGALRALGVDDAALSELEPHAETGLPNRAQLRRRFQELVPRLVPAEEPPPDAGTLERLWQSARQVVEVRPAGPQQGSSPAAIVSRIEAALAAGDLRRALEEWQALPPEAQAASQDWADEAGAVLAGEALAERLRGEALAELAP